MNAFRCLRSIYRLVIPGALVGLLGAQGVSRTAAFPLEVQPGGSDREEIELRLVDERVDALLELLDLPSRARPAHPVVAPTASRRRSSAAGPEIHAASDVTW